MTKDLSYLQNLIDQTISNVGSQQLIEFLEILNQPNLKKRICTFVITSVSNHYRINASRIKEDGSKKDTDTRMIITYLLKEFAKLSFAEIGDIVNRSKKNVWGYYHDMKYYIDHPSIEIDLINNYILLECQLKEFIAINEKHQL